MKLLIHIEPAGYLADPYDVVDVQFIQSRQDAGEDIGIVFVAAGVDQNAYLQLPAPYGQGLCGFLKPVSHRFRGGTDTFFRLRFYFAAVVQNTVHCSAGNTAHISYFLHCDAHMQSLLLMSLLYMTDKEYVK